MGVDVANFGGRQARHAQCSFDRAANRIAGGYLAVGPRLKRAGIAEDPRPDAGLPALGVLSALDDESRGAFAVDKPIPVGVKGPAGAGRVLGPVRYGTGTTANP